MNRFNPHNRYNGIYVPDGIYQHEDLTPTTKLVYARLLRYSGKNGKAYPKQTTIAKTDGTGYWLVSCTSDGIFHSYSITQDGLNTTAVTSNGSKTSFGEMTFQMMQTSWLLRH